MNKPFNVGDKVCTTSLKYPNIEGIVQQCFEAVGGWRVIFAGPSHPANPRGLYDFAAIDLRRLAA